MVIRSQSSRRPAAEMAWKVVAESRSERFTEHRGAWLPAKVRSSSFRYGNNGSYELSNELICSFEDWVVNPPVDAKTFRLHFPAGTPVTDSVIGYRTYLEGALSDSVIGNQVEQARRLVLNTGDIEERLNRASAENPFGPAPLWYWLGGLLVILITAGVAGTLTVISVRTRHRKPERPQ